MTMYRINASWQNWPGAPGVTTFFQNPAVAQPNPGAVRTFFNALASYLPTGLTVTVANSGDLVDEATGVLSGTWSSTPAQAIVTGSGSGAYAGNAGAVVHWLSSSVVGRRRLRGRSFIVPLTNLAYESNGSLSTTFLAAVQPAAQALVDATPGHFVVWHRPKAPVKGAPPVGGSMAAVTGTRVPDLAVSLRSRRI